MMFQKSANFDIRYFHVGTFSLPRPGKGGDKRRKRVEEEFRKRGYRPPSIVPVLMQQTTPQEVTEDIFPEVPVTFT